MKYIPILYKTEMVQAIDQDRKNQTRRTKGLDLINKNPDGFRYDGNEILDDTQKTNSNSHWFEVLDINGKPIEDYRQVICPYGKVGDILWVRETFSYYESTINMSAKNLEEKSSSVKIQYKSDGKISNNFSVNNITSIKAICEIEKSKTSNVIYKPSIFMPKEACRFFLKILDIRCERLNEITEIEARNEGVIHLVPFWKDYMNESFVYTAYASFKSLWQKINSIKQWDSNPWVWVIEFEKVEKPENFN